MPVVRPIAPDELKAALERAGLKVIDETERNWVLSAGPGDEPITIPKRGKRVSVGLMNRAFRRAPQDVLDAVRQAPVVHDDDDAGPDDGD